MYFFKKKKKMSSFAGRREVGNERFAFHRRRRLQVHAGVQQGKDDAGVPGIDDRLPIAALEWQLESHERTPMFKTRSGRALFHAPVGRRHAISDGIGLDRQRARKKVRI